MRLSASGEVASVDAETQERRRRDAAIAAVLGRGGHRGPGPSGPSSSSGGSGGASSSGSASAASEVRSRSQKAGLGVQRKVAAMTETDPLVKCNPWRAGPLPPAFAGHRLRPHEDSWAAFLENATRRPTSAPTAAVGPSSGRSQPPGRWPGQGGGAILVTGGRAAEDHRRVGHRSVCAHRPLQPSNAHEHRAGRSA